MDGATSVCSDDEPIFNESVLSGENANPDPDTRERIAIRDQLILRVFEEEAIYMERLLGQGSLEWISYEVNPLKIWNRLEFDRRIHVIRTRVAKINRLKDLQLTLLERIDPSTKNTSMLGYLQTLRHDWLRGKVAQRQKDRFYREDKKKFNAIDILWHKVR